MFAFHIQTYLTLTLEYIKFPNKMHPSFKTKVVSFSILSFFYFGFHIRAESHVSHIKIYNAIQINPVE